MTVSDIMNPDVVSVPPDLTVRELTRLLSDQGISGVPVVDTTGEVLGVVSSTDVVRLAAEESEVAVTGTRWVPIPAPAETRDPEDEEEDLYGAFFLPEDAPMIGPEWAAGTANSPMDQLTVTDIMTPVSFSVEPDTSVSELADFLVRGRIHRALVLEDGRLQGIVTSMDLLKALADGHVAPAGG